MTNSSKSTESEADQSGLTSRSILEINGDDATRFLQAQLSSNIETLQPGAVNWSSWLTAKGRVIAVFLIIRLEDNRYLLVVPSDLVEALLKRLKMFILRAKVNVTERSWPQHVYFDDAKDTNRTQSSSRASANEAAYLTPLLDVRDPVITLRFTTTGATSVCYEIVRDRQFSPEPERTEVNENDWQSWCILNGLPWITSKTTDQFIPQSLNLDAIDGLSYDKGCYPGQEIVARTHFKGRLKYRTAMLEFEPNSNLTPGEKVSTSEDTARSATLLTVSHNSALAVVPVQWLENHVSTDQCLDLVQVAQRPADEFSSSEEPVHLQAILTPPPYALPVS